MANNFFATDTLAEYVSRRLLPALNTQITSVERAKAVSSKPATEEALPELVNCKIKVQMFATKSAATHNVNTAQGTPSSIVTAQENDEQISPTL